MHIGLTFDLRSAYLAAGYSEEETAEFDRPDTIEAIELTLRDLGYVTDRIGHVRQLVHRLAVGETWNMVLNIAEGLRGYGREAQVPALLDAYNIPYTFSDTLVLALTLHKAMTKRVIRDLGIPTPDFFVVELDSDLDKLDLLVIENVGNLVCGVAGGAVGTRNAECGMRNAKFGCRSVSSGAETPPGGHWTAGPSRTKGSHPERSEGSSNMWHRRRKSSPPPFWRQVRERRLRRRSSR